MFIQGATIINGTGTRRFVGNVRIQNEHIVAIGDIKPDKEEEVLNAEGLYLTPGFVDILNHSDAYVTLFQNPTQESLVRQGFTTILMGNCGSSLAPLVRGALISSIQKWGNPSKINVNWRSFHEYSTELEKHRFGVNVATLIGHGTVRRGLVGDEARHLTKAELEQVEYLLQRSIEEGAFGISMGLAYAHGKPTTEEELERVMDLTKRSDTMLALHLRNEDKGLFASVLEGVTAAKKYNASIEFSHLKAVGKEAWGQFENVLQLIENTDNAHFDIYPYTTTASVLYTFLPEWVMRGGNKTMLPALQDATTRKKVIEEMKKDPHDYAQMTVAMGALQDVFFGKTVSDIAKTQDVTPEEAVLNLIATSHNRVIVYTQSIQEKNLEAAIQHARSFIASDGAGYSLQDSEYGELPHPRSFGAAPQFLEIFVVQKKLLSWEKAIQKITSGPAQKIGIKQRGKIEVGSYADLVLINPKKIQSPATLINPYQYPLGIEYVFVNGIPTVAHGKLTTRTAGKILRKT